MSDFPAQTRQILDKVVQGKLSKTEASQKLSVSRKTIYQWLKKHSDFKPGSTPTKRKRLQKDILRIVAANPEYGPRKVSREVGKMGKKLSERSVWKLFRELEITTADKRKVYSQRYKKPALPRDKIALGHLKLNAESRKRMVEEVILAGKSVKDIVGEYGVSRKTFAKWKRRYLLAQSAGKNILLALSDQNPRGSKHPKGVSERMEKAVLELVLAEPELSSHKIAKRLKFIGNHGVQRILERLKLSTYQARLSFAKTQEIIPKPAFARVLDRVLLVWEQFVPSLAPAPPPKATWVFRRVSPIIKPLLASVTIAVFVAFIVYSLTRLIPWVVPVKGAPQVGQIFAGIALFMGSVFFLYSLKYYLTLAIVLSFSQQGVGELANGNGGRRRAFLSWVLGLANGDDSSSSKASRGKAVGLEPNLEHVTLKKYPPVSVHIPLYNETKVVERALKAACSFDCPEYEIIFADDSTDETSTIIKEYQRSFGKLRTKKGDGWTLTWVEIRPGVAFKHLHRNTRSGFKGGALREALNVSNPAAEFIAVFDADFVPYPDTLELFLKYFKVQNNMSEAYKKSDVAAVQGYQWHVLNKSENWITRSVRSEYAGSYVVERSGNEILGSIKQISGSAYMIRRDVLDEIGWGTSITEDFELTLKLYERGYKIVYTPYVQAPAECVSTVKDLVRQRMRWAEGHSNNVKRMFFRLLFKSTLKPIEKLELLYFCPYYLQASFFLIGTTSWILAETIFPANLPFWTALWGWSMVLTNFLSLPLMNAVGLFLEESEERDYVGLTSFVALSYLLAPFQAYASLKGFLEGKEGPWFRTPKTGRITDIFTRGKFYRFIAGVVPGFRSASIIREADPAHLSQYLALATANNRFNSFRIKPKGKRWLGKAILSLLLALTVTVYSYTHGVPEVLATNPGSTLWLYDEASNVLDSTTAEWKLEDSGADTSSSTSTIASVNNKDSAPAWYQYTPGQTNLDAESGTTCSANTPDNAGWILEDQFGGSGGSIASGDWTFYFNETDNRSGNVGSMQVCVWSVAVSGGTISSSTLLFGADSGTDIWDGVDTDSSFTSNQPQHNIGANEYLYVEYFSNMTTIDGGGAPTEYTSTFRTGPTYSNPRIVTQGITIPEFSIVFLVLSPAIPYLTHLWLRKKSLKVGFI